jgi:hypothetical protein
MTDGPSVRVLVGEKIKTQGPPKRSALRAELARIERQQAMCDAAERCGYAERYQLKLERTRLRKEAREIERVLSELAGATTRHPSRPTGESGERSEHGFDRSLRGSRSDSAAPTTRSSDEDSKC